MPTIIPEHYKVYLTKDTIGFLSILKTFKTDIFKIYSDLSTEHHKLNNSSEECLKEFFDKNNLTIMKEITNKSEIIDYINFPN